MSDNEKVGHTEEVPTKESSLENKVQGEDVPAAAAAADEEPRKKREYKEMEHKTEGDLHAKVDMNTIQFTAADLYDKDKVDIEHVVMEEVYQLLQCTDAGLTETEAVDRIGIFGPNKLEEKSENVLLQFLSFMWNPLSWVMEGAALVAIALSNGGGTPPDWQDFVGIVLLLFVNSTIGFVEERNAGNAVKALMDSLAPKARVKRDGQWKEIESAELVPGDLIAFKHGDVCPSDCRLVEAIDVSMDQAALTGESLPVGKSEGDECFSGSTCKQGEAEGIVIATGPNTFFGRAATLVGQDNDQVGHLQQVLARIGSFCLCSIGIFVLLEILILYADFRYPYRRGLDNILVLLIGGIPIAMPTVLSVTLAVGAQQLAKHKAIVTRITAIEELAGVTILCSDKTGTLTTNKLTIDKENVKCYSKWDVEGVCLLAAYASRTENQDAIDGCVVGTLPDPKQARGGIQLLDFKPFNPVDKRTEITYRDDMDGGKLKRATKGMTGIIIELCSRGKTNELEDQLEADVEEFARRGLRALAVAYEDVAGDDPSAEGNGFELVGLLSIFDPPRSDTKKTIDDAMALGVKVKMVTGDQLAIAKETGRRLGLGDHMYPAKVLKEGPEAGGKHANLDEMIMDADGFAGVFPEHKFEIVKRIQNLGHLCAMTGDGANDAPALSRANVGIAVEGATDAARGAADIVLTEPGLSTIVHAIYGSRVIFQRMRNYAIYACAVTIRIVLCFAIMAFAWRFDFPPFMVLIIAVLNDGTIMTLSLDRVLPSTTPDSWDLAEVFSFGVAYGIYLSASTIALYATMENTSFFEDRFGVEPLKGNSYGGHMVIYLQVAIISQALIFVTRSHGPSWTERPSVALMLAFCLAQLVSSIIAAYADWSFSQVHSISGGWIGIVWVWNIVWYFPLDGIKFIMKKTVIAALQRRKARKAGPAVADAALHRAPSRHESLYSNRTNFLTRAANRLRGGAKISMSQNELQRFSSIQAQQSGAALTRAHSRPAA
ncbi:plasma-membrane proton-efflux P-type ATPase [Cryptococcus neoformans]|uniref:Plasma membrane ATPase n=3 Tax=Cryptococcus neoformans TaxID=5207 RepID=A0A854QAQ1_CRYNE|nr:plasma-membrane proton-efflux P-type ATPase [Cryptococcus neoformans var. grubii H99]AAF24511.1 plasma membrane H(+)-ATPase [Cryptococcus neoformans var. grubii]OWT35841.1 plasma-membrane proton-efflux P-type ATPase [Cryptococcus neoformans var. grubii Bt1]OWZ26964.1 plasma-membrane proton-efflux P-type ATPase [Cryptococcus neoformans var. grubii AD2-60a]OWZ27795.1 plasma-membrane proton-efflux P-type ATPase [Cryptococcus neoformans var. grubii AD1-83a]OWZ38825.1 plasma-membrane proton-effl|eukprot:XP_012053467.1 plasma-membrane proton-efflux P-type ATPase [Cryptococcus neoformans var. grubii H99]